MINKEYKMNLNEWLETTEFTTKDLELLPSVGCVINTKNGDTFPLMDDDSIGFDEPMNIIEMYNDEFNSEEWFNSLHTCDKPVVNMVLEKLLPNKVKII